MKVLQFCKLAILTVLKTAVYLIGWLIELSGKLLQTISESLFKLIK